MHLPNLGASRSLADRGNCLVLGSANRRRHQRDIPVSAIHMNAHVTAYYLEISRWRCLFQDADMVLIIFDRTKRAHVTSHESLHLGDAGNVFISNVHMEKSATRRQKIA